MNKGGALDWLGLNFGTGWSEELGRGFSLGFGVGWGFGFVFELVGETSFGEGLGFGFDD